MEVIFNTILLGVVLIACTEIVLVYTPDKVINRITDKLFNNGYRARKSFKRD